MCPGSGTRGEHLRNALHFLRNAYSLIGTRHCSKQVTYSVFSVLVIIFTHRSAFCLFLVTSSEIWTAPDASLQLRSTGTLPAARPCRLPAQKYLPWTVGIQIFHHATSFAFVRKNYFSDMSRPCRQNHVGKTMSAIGFFLFGFVRWDLVSGTWPPFYAHRVG